MQSSSEVVSSYRYLQRVHSMRWEILDFGTAQEKVTGFNNTELLT